MEPTQESRRDFLRSVRHGLDLLLKDTELQEAGFNYLYVVDFAAIYAYIYKRSDPPFVEIPGEPEERTFARRQLALRALFSGYPGPLLLIPPYSAEMYNHLHSLTARIGLAALDARILYREKLSRLISKSEHFQAFLRLKSEKGRRIEESVRQAALELGKEYFPELYTTVSFSSLRGQEALQALFKNKVLTDADQLIPECRELDYTAPDTDDWYVRINKRRKGERAYQSRTDAMACMYLSVANQRLNPHKRVVVFVSPSASVEAVLSDRALICTDSDTRTASLVMVRNLTYCLLAYSHKNNRVLISENLKTVDRLLPLYESPIPVSWRERRDEATRDWTRCENLLLMSDPDLVAVESANPQDNEFLEVLHQLSLAASQDSAGIAEEIEKKLSKLQSETEALNKVLVSERTVKLFESIRIRPDSQGVLIVFPGLQDELATGIRFLEKNAQRLARSFQKLQEENYPQCEVMKLRAYIKDAADRLDATAEHLLLDGYLLAMERSYEAALMRLNNALAKAEGRERKEILFVIALVQRKLHRGSEACDALEQALAEDDADLRLRTEYAKALWLKWKQQGEGNGNQHLLEQALSYLEIHEPAHSNRDKLLHAQVKNVSAYLHTELARHAISADVDPIAEAEKSLAELQMLVPEDQWLGRFFDTRAYLFYVKAIRLTGADQQRKHVLLEQAARDSNKALEKEEDLGELRGVRREHHALITEELVKMEANASRTSNP